MIPNETKQKPPTQPFFVRFLEPQPEQKKEDNEIGPQTLKYPSDWDEW